MKWALASKMNLVNILSAAVMLGQSQDVLAIIPPKYVALAAGAVNLLNIVLRSYTSQAVSWVPPSK